MTKEEYKTALALMKERYGRDNLMPLATMDGRIQHVRFVNAYYEDGCLYTVTYALSNKMKQIAENPRVAICLEWFTGHGLGENLGYIRAPENEELAARLRSAFASWYDNGHTNEEDPNTCILRVRLTDGVMMDHGKRYDMDFTSVMW